MPAQGTAESRFQQAHQQAEAKKPLAALAGFEASIADLPLLQDHALFFTARLQISQDQPAQARIHLDRLLREHPDSVWTADALVLRGNLQLALKNPQEALADYGRAIRQGSAGSRTAARLGRARALAATGRASEAWVLALELPTQETEEGQTASHLREELAALGPQALGVLPTTFITQLSRVRLASGDAPGALRILLPLQGQSLAPRTRAQIESLLATAFRVTGETQKATATLDGLIQRGTPTDLAGTALYGRARRAWNRDEDATAKVDYLLFLEKFPAHARTPDTLHALARIAEAAGDLPQAAQRYREIGERYPKSRVAETAAWRRGFAHYRNDNFTAAAEAWHTQGPTEAGDYWRARALEGLAQPRIATKIREELLQKWPMSYYAWWLAPTTTKASEPLTTPKAVPPQTATAQRHRAKANLLAQLDLPESAERELDAVRRETGNTAFLMGAYADIGAWQRSILIARALESRGETGLERHIHPQAHLTQFQRAGKKYGLDPLLLASLSRRESLFEERARSPVGAYGLMQLMPATAKQLAGRHVPTQELALAEVNIDLGARYLAELLQEYEGRLVLALAAYNAGPKAVARWQKKNGAATGDEFVELISYRETRKYVKAVLENYRIYRSLYGNSTALPRIY